MNIHTICSYVHDVSLRFPPKVLIQGEVYFIRKQLPAPLQIFYSKYVNLSSASLVHVLISLILNRIFKKTKRGGSEKASSIFFFQIAPLVNASLRHVSVQVNFVSGQSILEIITLKNVRKGYGNGSSTHFEFVIKNGRIHQCFVSARIHFVHAHFCPSITGRGRSQNLSHFALIMYVSAHTLPSGVQGDLLICLESRSHYECFMRKQIVPKL